MWPFTSHSSLISARVTDGMTDWHSHILPGVDDGVETLSDSLEILKAYEEMGFREVWLTPHIMEDCPNTTSNLRMRFEELKNAYSGSLQLHLAAENMLDPLFSQRLEEGDVLPLGPRGEHLLVETSYINPPAGFHDLLQKIRSKGFFPVLAHPERYRYMNLDDYRSLREKGTILQINLFSLLGIYGPDARIKAEWLLRHGMTDIAGSDIHRPSMLRFFNHKLKSGKALSHLRSTAQNQIQ